MPTNKILTYAGLGSASLLASLPVFLTLGPVFNSPNASAEEAPQTTALYVNSAIALTAENVTVSATPTVGNTFITGSSTVNVKNTGSPGGYHLSMYSDNGGTLNHNTKSGEKVESIEGYSKTGTEMKAATSSSWGYTTQSVVGTSTAPAVNDNEDLEKTYFPIPLQNGTTWGEAGDEASNRYAYLASTDKYINQTDGDNIKVGYGFAIGPDTTAGAYTDTIVYTAVVNPRTPQNLSEAKYMQDFGYFPNVCKNTPTPAVTATESVTDLGTYTVGQKNIDKIPTVTLTDTRDDSIYTVKKLADGNCWMTDSLRIAGKTLKPADSNVSADYPLSKAGTGFGVDSSDASKDVVYYGTIENVGSTMLYSFNTATAGTGAKITSDIMSAGSDICPKGWHLPNCEGNASWNKLLRVDQSVYQIATTSNDWVSGGGTGGWGTYAKLSKASDNPLGLQLTGLLLNSETLDDTGNGGYWTRTAKSDTNAYNLGYNGRLVYPQGSGNKYVGFGVRCVSEGTTE